MLPPCGLGHRLSSAGHLHRSQFCCAPETSPAIMRSVLQRPRTCMRRRECFVLQSRPNTPLRVSRMDQTVREHIAALEERLKALSAQLMEEPHLKKRNALEI